ncbi:hypothetical protein [Baaleninema simplex]|uniref:hypothetical protein n=1 Tax=Baaleninema simplex TaxID=2862350 RepID=UPI00130DA781|nr:hypothetical protein [Baaleninema simplex]
MSGKFLQSPRSIDDRDRNKGDRRAGNSSNGAGSGDRDALPARPYSSARLKAT